MVSVEPGQGLGHVARVDIGHEAQVDRRGQRAQRIPDHARPQIRAANADMDDGLEGPAGRPGLGARAHAPGVVGHGQTHGVHLGRDRLAQGLEVRPGGRPQRRVQHRPALGGVDRLAREHPRPRRLDAGRPGQGDTGLEPLAGPALLGQIEIQPRRLDAHPRHPIRVGSELIDDPGLGVPGGGQIESGPIGAGWGVGHAVIHRVIKLSFTGQA